MAEDDHELNERDRIELHHAFVWNCPICGSENYTRATEVELSEIDEDELREILISSGELEEWQPTPTAEEIEEAGGSLSASPDALTCKTCDATFGGDCECDDSQS